MRASSIISTIGRFLPPLHQPSGALWDSQYDYLRTFENIKLFSHELVDVIGVVLQKEPRLDRDDTQGIYTYVGYIQTLFILLTYYNATSITVQKRHSSSIDRTGSCLASSALSRSEPVLAILGMYLKLTTRASGLTLLIPYVNEVKRILARSTNNLGKFRPGS